MKPALNSRSHLWTATALALLLLVPEARAHGSESHAGVPWWLRWNFDPLILANLAAVTAFYGIGLRNLWRRAGAGRGGVSFFQAGAFGAGIATLFLALVSPVDPMADELSWVHMVQHMLLMMIAAPLLIAGSPGRVFLWCLGTNQRQRIGAWFQRRWRHPRYLLWQPLAVWTLYAVTLWIWHLPALYESALANRWIHDFQHLAFLGVSCLFWRVLIDPISRLRMSRGAGVLYLFTTSLHATLLGVFMTLSPRVWYSAYEAKTPGWNLAPLEDQQLAGLIMWMPACMIYAAAAAVLFGFWLRETQWNPEFAVHGSQSPDGGKGQS